jgi:hypothetical protein
MLNELKSAIALKKQSSQLRLSGRTITTLGVVRFAAVSTAVKIGLMLCRFAFQPVPEVG